MYVPGFVPCISCTLRSDVLLCFTPNTQKVQKNVYLLTQTNKRFKSTLIYYDTGTQSSDYVLLRYILFVYFYLCYIELFSCFCVEFEWPKRQFSFYAFTIVVFVFVHFCLKSIYIYYLTTIIKTKTRTKTKKKKKEKNKKKSCLRWIDFQNQCSLLVT